MHGAVLDAVVDLACALVRIRGMKPAKSPRKLALRTSTLRRLDALELASPHGRGTGAPIDSIRICPPELETAVGVCD